MNLDPYHLDEYDRDNVGLVMRDGTYFTAHLFRLCAKADGRNLERIRLGFPEVVAAFEAWRAS